MRKYFAEGIGTFALMFCGAGAVVIDEITKGSVSHVGIAITFGLIVMSMIYSIGDISGAHMNPAVTLAFAINKSFQWKEVMPYLVSQAIGAFAAMYILKFLFPSSIVLGSTLPSGEAMQSFLLEIILSFFLMFVILNVATGSKEQGMFAGLAIGSVVLLEAMFAGPISGASMNPIRSLAPAIVAGHSAYLWIYLSAPFIGTILAVFFYRIIKNKS